MTWGTGPHGENHKKTLVLSGAGELGRSGSKEDSVSICKAPPGFHVHSGMVALSTWVAKEEGPELQRDSVQDCCAGEEGDCAAPGPDTGCLREEVSSGSVI